MFMASVASPVSSNITSMSSCIMKFSDMIKLFLGLNSPEIRDPDIFNDSFTDFIRDSSSILVESDNCRNWENLEDSFGYESSFVNMFQHMDDLISDIFATDSASFLTLPQINTPLNEENPRNKMLKPSDDDSYSKQPWFSRFFHPKGFDDHPGSLNDTDIDDTVSQGGLEAITVATEENIIAPPNNWSFRKSFSMKTVKDINGVIEEHCTMKDSEGNEVTTVRKSLGDQSYEIKTVRDSQGGEETKENFINLDSNTINEFKQRWQKQKLLPINPQDDVSDSSSGLLYTSRDSIYKFFSKLF